MNLPDLTKNVRRHLAEAGSGLHDEARIEAQVRRSARDLARQHHLFKGVTSLEIGGDGHLTLPADFAGLAAPPVMAGGVSLGLVTPDEVLHLGRPWTVPAFYWGEEYDTGGRVLLYGAVRGPVVLSYYRYPPDPGASVEAWGGRYEEYHDLIALHAAHQLAGHSGPSGAREAVWLQRFEQRKDEFRAYLATARLGNARMQFTTRTTFPSRRF